MENLVGALQRLIAERKQACLEIIDMKYAAIKEGNHARAEWLDGRLSGIGTTLCDIVDLLKESGV